MIRNYFRVAVRYLLRYKGYTAINILGLAVGITSCILIMLFIRSEFSYDKFHSKSNRIYRLAQLEKYEGEDFRNTVTPLSMGPVMQQTFPEIESICRVFATSRLVKVDQNSFTEDIRMVDSTFFNQFDFELISGNKQIPFPTSNSVILTTETAKKFFGNTDATGKQVQIEMGDEKILYTVSGIANKAPEESSIKYKMLIPFSNAKYLFGPGAFRSWFNVNSETYVLVRQNENISGLQKKFPAMIKAQLGADYKEGNFKIAMQPIAEIHLDTTMPAGNEPISNPKYSYILGTIGVLLLLLACINFITLSIGRSTTRAMEVGLRKVLGAERQQLIRQFWGEAFLLTLISVFIGLGLSSILIKPFNQLINRDLHLHFDSGFVFFSLLMIAIIALIAGIYPAFILSGFKPIEVLKGKLKMKGNTGWLRQSLVVGQFVASIAMIVCTIVVGEQMNYLLNKDLGYNKQQIIAVSTHKNRIEGAKMAQLYRTELLKHPEVEDASISMYAFTEPSWMEIGFTDEKKVYHGFQFNSVDPYFLKTMKIETVKGRAFLPDNTADITSSALVNEAFVREFGLTDPIGKKLPGPFDQQIVGVVKDFNYMSLHNRVRPLLLVVQPDSVFRRTENISFASPPQPKISVRLRPGSLTSSVGVLKKAWTSVVPGQEFDYEFLDETLAAQYQAEKRTDSIVKIASGLSIFIACMGLFGLATLAVTRRTKEIGIRKVLGANVGGIVALLSKEFAKLILIASVIAIPLAWWFINDWLKDFAYRVSISWWVFIIAAFVSFFIALATISFQAIRAAVANPVRSLRTE